MLISFTIPALAVWTVAAAAAGAYLHHAFKRKP